MLQVVGTLYISKVDPALAANAASPADVAKMIEQACEKTNGVIKIPQRVQLDPTTAVPWSDPAALHAVTESYLHRRTINTLGQDVLERKSETTVGLGEGIETEEALRALLRKYKGLVPINLQTKDVSEYSTPALVGIDSQNRLVIWAPTLGGVVNPTKIRGESGELQITCSRMGDTPGAVPKPVVFTLAAQIIGAVKGTELTPLEQRHLTQSRTVAELSGVVPNCEGVSFGVSHVLEVIGEGKETPQVVEQSKDLALRLVYAANRNQVFEYPESILCADGQQVPTRSFRGLVELASYTQRERTNLAFSPEADALLGYVKVSQADDVISSLKQDPDKTVTLQVKSSGANSVSYSLLLKADGDGFVAYDPNYPGKHVATLVSTKELSKLEADSTPGAAQLRYKRSNGSEVLVTIEGVYRAKRESMEPVYELLPPVPPVPFEASPSDGIR